MATKKNKTGSTVDFLRSNSGTVQDNQLAPQGGNTDDAFGTRRQHIPSVTSALEPTPGAPRAARSTGKPGQAAEGAPKA